MIGREDAIDMEVIYGLTGVLQHMRGCGELLLLGRGYY